MLMSSTSLVMPVQRRRRSGLIGPDASTPTRIARVHPIRLNHATGVPVFQQIVEQITYMIETGQLDDGDQLPSSRMLADNLHVNRNTVARAYGELGKRGLVSSQGRRGLAVPD